MWTYNPPLDMLRIYGLYNSFNNTSSRVTLSHDSDKIELNKFFLKSFLFILQ